MNLHIEILINLFILSVFANFILLITTFALIIAYALIISK